MLKDKPNKFFPSQLAFWSWRPVAALETLTETMLTLQSVASTSCLNVVYVPKHKESYHNWLLNITYSFMSLLSQRMVAQSQERGTK